MAITINNNTMASNANRNLSATYSKLATNIQRMSSGLRVNSAADDAAGLPASTAMPDSPAGRLSASVTTGTGWRMMSRVS